ncbi:MAG: acyl-CoA/acyl-ACP dehydrogenase [Pseudomonadales bacterium]|nr:acyl-CoA/acyl-ACP dehydrogenase [Pseudomonadales bacterium]
MQFAFTDEQEQFRDIVARFCRDKSPTTAVRKLTETDQGFDPGIWRQLCQEIGVTGIHIPEDRGGAGFSPVELGIVMEEFGRSLIPVPYFSCAVLACTAVSEISENQIRESLLSQMASGDKLGTLVLEEERGTPLTGIECKETDGEWALSGISSHVLDGHLADFILVIGKTAAGQSLFMVEANASGLSAEPLHTMDRTRRQARMTFENVSAEKLCDLDESQMDRIYNTALVSLANEMVGGAQALLDETLEYTKLRYQFGRSIASFQAIKHRMADLLVDVELARTAAYQAAQSLAENDEDAASNASLAKFVAAETYIKSALEAIQLHGGVGFTWENDTHLWFRRAKSSEVLLGSPAFNSERMLQEMQV